MDEQLARIVGDRLRFHRTAAYKTKTVVAGLADITPDYLYQLERGQKLPTIVVLARLAEVLGVEPGALLEHQRPHRKQQPPSKIDGIYRALTGPLPHDIPMLSPAELHREVLDAWTTWQRSPQRYSRLAAELPALIAATEQLARTSTADHRLVHGCAADLYCLLRSVTKRLGRIDLALLATDRALRAAEAADDPLRTAGARWNLAQVLLADEQPDGAEAVALEAIGQIQPIHRRGNQDATALSGALLLVAAVAAARRGDGWTARTRLQQAEPLATRTGERNSCWTAFGPTNVAMHAVSIEVETGEAVEGLRLAERVDHSRSTSIERRVAFLLDQAKGYGQRRDYARALTVLAVAEREAPEDIRHRPAAHTTLRRIMERGPRGVSKEATTLAKRVGLPL